VSWAPSASRRRGRVVVAMAGAGGSGSSGKITVKDMKAALVAAGWDTSDCFERADLERKFVLLSPAQQAVTAAAGACTASGAFEGG
jgi:hypothetical protein